MWQSILTSVLGLLPTLISSVETLAGPSAGQGPAKQQAVMNLIGSGVAIAGVSDPKQATLITSVAQDAIPGVVALFNAVGWPAPALTPAAAPAPASAAPAASQA